MTALATLVAVLAVTALVAWLLRRNDGRVRSVEEDASPSELVDLGVSPQRWSLVEFTAPSCHPCAQARRVLDDVATAAGHVDVVAVDVAEHVDAARHHGVLRAPTTLVIAPGGHVLAKISGVPRANDLRMLLHERPALSRSADQ